MVLHVRHVLECSEGNPNLRGDSVELCSGGGGGGGGGGVCGEGGDCWGCVPKVSQCPTSVMNGKTYEYISMDNNIQFI